MEGSNYTGLRRIAYAVVVTVATVVLVTDVLAQTQSPAQQKCLKNVVKRVAKLIRAQGKEFDSCMRMFAQSGGNRFACLNWDSKGRVAKARQKLIDTEGKVCGEMPDFGFLGSAELIEAAIAWRVHMTWSYYDALDSPPACSKTYLRYAAKLLTRKWRGFGKCLKAGLADSSIQSSVDVIGCFSRLDSSTDPKLMKILDALATKMEDKSCGLPFRWWGMPIFDSTSTIRDTAEGHTRCFACQTLRLGGGLSVDCDVFDDGFANGTCSQTCGDGEVSGLEECDDGNLVNGDGCDLDCTVSSCGNGMPAGGELCDLVWHSSGPGGVCVGGSFDGLPCWVNSECADGYCSSCFGLGCNGCVGCGAPLCWFDSPGHCTMWVAECRIGSACFGIQLFPCSDPGCAAEGNCTINGHCVPTTAEWCTELEGVPGPCTLAP